MRTLLDGGVLFAPSKAANAGGVAVSGLEQSQNLLRISWSHAEVDERLRGIVSGIHQQCAGCGAGDDGRVNHVRGANLAGFKRIADAMLAYGIVGRSTESQPRHEAHVPRRALF
jgi:glutamate dehydrogenase (NADP+)